jgi:hypothetical protein
MPQLLPGQAQRALLRAKIKSGSIIHLFCNFITVPHNKFVVVIYIDNTDDLILVFFINSEIYPLTAKNPSLMSCQVDLLKSRYLFLDHDSHIDCTNVIDSFSIDEVINHLLQKPDDYKGELLENEISEIVQAVHLAPTISEYDKSLIIDSFENGN